MADDKTINGARQQFLEQIEFFRKKLNLPTETHRSIKQAANDRGFVVAGAMKSDLLDDLRKVVDGAVVGGSIGEFRKQFNDIVAKHGWTGWTGEGSEAGEAWRTRVIYQTNIMTSYSAGRRAQMLAPDFVAHYPYWRYVHSDGVIHPRPHHKQWGDMKLTLRHDDPFWETHYPPNGWGCKCRVLPVAKPTEGDAIAPPEDWHQNDPSTGAPAGIDEGWDYAPGARQDDDLRTFVQDKLIEYPPAISKALTEDMGKVINAEERVDSFVKSVLADSKRSDELWMGFVDKPSAIQQLTGIDPTDYTLLMPAQNVRDAFASGLPRGLKASDFLHVEQILNDFDALKLSPESGSLGEPRVVATKQIGSETFSSVFELRSAKRERALALISLLIEP